MSPFPVPTTDFKGQTTAYLYDTSSSFGGRLSKEYRFATGVAALDSSQAIRTAYAAGRTGPRVQTEGVILVRLGPVARIAGVGSSGMPAALSCFEGESFLWKDQ